MKLSAESSRCVPSLSVIGESDARLLPELDECRKTPWSWTGPVVLGVLALGAMSLDLPIARFFAQKPAPVFVKEVLYHAESFGHAVGVTLILIAVVHIDRRRWSLFPRMLTCSLGAGLLANLLKLVIERTRPNSMTLDAVSVTSTFGRWIPGLSSSSLQSFPSAHTATAVGLAVVLSAMYPRGRLYFAVMAALCGLHRINANVHYSSDVLFGAAVGWFTAAVCLRSRAFERAENFLTPRVVIEGSVRRAA